MTKLGAKRTNLNIQVHRMYRFESDRPLKAFADIIINDCLLIKGIKLLDGKNGLFVSMPQEQAQDKKWYDTVRCLTEEVKDQISSVLISAYEDESGLPKPKPKKKRKVKPKGFDEIIKDDVRRIIHEQTNL
jgi:stage V sporulation protein G